MPDTYAVSADELRQFIERIERLAIDKQDTADTIKEVFAEAKSRGYDTKAMRRVIARRKMERDALAEEEAMIEIYETALEGK